MQATRWRAMGKPLLQQCQKILALWVLVLSTCAAVPLSGGASNHSQVLIIGAGAAGYAAASRLMENNVYDLTILEAGGRVGGRVHTVRFAENIVDLGAEWVHGEAGNVVHEMAAPLGLLSHSGKSLVKSLSSNMAFVWSGGAVPEAADIKLLLNISMSVGSRRDMQDQLASYTGSYGQWFLDRFAHRLAAEGRQPPPGLVDSYLDWFEKYLAFDDGSDTWFDTSARGLSVYKECDGDLNLMWKNGYQTVFDLLTKRYPDPAQELPVRQRVRPGSEVAAIHWAERVDGTEPRPDGQPQGVVVELANGARYSADMVLVTVSLGVLKHSADALFRPPLPQRKMNAVRNLGFGQVNKLFLYFAEPWWPSALSGYSVLVTREDLERFTQKYPQYGARGHWLLGLSGFYIDEHRPNVVLMDWVVGEPARNMEKYPDHEVMAGCRRWLDLFLGHNHSIPLPTGFARSQWWSNPHFRGSYSYRSLDSDRADAWAAHLAEPILDGRGTPVVMFAGEATHDHFYGTVHGAIETGWREADRILSTLKSEGSRLRPA